jgi:hypothetical protein
MAARELGWLSLEDALGLCVLYRQCAPATGVGRLDSRRLIRPTR